MLQDKRIIFVTMSLLILFVLAMYFYKAKRGMFGLNWERRLSLAGSIGNLIERAKNGFVVDFLDFRVINFPVFNIADMAVCIGAAPW